MVTAFGNGLLDRMLPVSSKDDTLDCECGRFKRIHGQPHGDEI